MAKIYDENGNNIEMNIIEFALSIICAIVYSLTYVVCFIIVGLTCLLVGIGAALFFLFYVIYDYLSNLLDSIGCRFDALYYNLKDLWRK